MLRSSRNRRARSTGRAGATRDVRSIGFASPARNAGEIMCSSVPEHPSTLCSVHSGGGTPPWREIIPFRRAGHVSRPADCERGASSGGCRGRFRVGTGMTMAGKGRKAWRKADELVGIQSCSHVKRAWTLQSGSRIEETHHYARPYLGPADPALSHAPVRRLHRCGGHRAFAR